MKRKDWKPRTATERQYQISIEQINKALRKRVKEVKTLQQLIDSFHRFSDSETFKKFTQELAFNMVRTVAAQNYKTWREAARASGRSAEIYRLLNAEFGHNPKLQAIVSSNAELIRSIPKRNAETISKQAARYAIEGRRADALLKEYQDDLDTLPGYQARTIARTEIAKTQSAITQIRAQELGVDWFVWESSQDQRTRESHKHMQGVICRYSDLPSPEALNGEKEIGRYGPGEIFNCRCFAAPIVDESQVPEAVKVYESGKIQRISRKKFLEIQ
jgi:SPP1 gp7 family putative phage head morphogenesis protein